MPPQDSPDGLNDFMSGIMMFVLKKERGSEVGDETNQSRQPLLPKWIPVGKTSHLFSFLTDTDPLAQPPVRTPDNYSKHWLPPWTPQGR
jgi:hypothetical protein